MKDFTTTRPKLDARLRFMSEAEHRCMRNHLEPGRAKVALDLACGTGRNVPQLLELADRVIAVDSSAEFVRQVGEKLSPADRHRVELVVADVATYRPAAPADLVVLSGILLLFSDDEATAFLRNVAAMVASGGRLWSREAVSPAYTWTRLENERFPASFYRPRTELHRLIERSVGVRLREFGYLRPIPERIEKWGRRAGRLLGDSAAERVHDAMISVSLRRHGAGATNDGASRHEAELSVAGSNYAFAWGVFEKSAD